MAFSDSSKFDSIMEEIEQLVNWYEEKNRDQGYVKVFLASGECFKYYPTKDSIAHMLGIKTDFLSTCGMFKNTKSYELIKELIKEQYRISSKILNNEIKLSDIFSKHIHKKLDIFKLNIGINLDNTLFVCKYNRNKAIEYGNNPRNCDYIIVQELEDGQILELDIVSNGNYTKPVSSRMYENELEAKNEFKELLKYQDISILTSIIINTEYYDENKKIYLKENKKLSKLQQIENIKLRYDCNIDVAGDCKYYYKRSLTGRNIGKNNYDVTSQIIDYIKEGKLIDKNALDISYSELSIQQIELIDTLNDIIMMGIKDNNDDNKEKYSSLEKQVKNLKEVKISLEKENKKLKEANLDLTEERDELKKQSDKAKVLELSISNALNNYRLDDKNIG